ncbi:MAG: hypothetical protein CVU19_02805 [Betaproteobacteria bacterium HGW-Betaproteobacteria-13]|uniref:Uncharacterized protein n=1 Tax=Parazoarcus communis TaxID=41977 RepID=A0A2U8H508_9RHOO|nr:hypothetical protein CEW87_15820 [Parazoarcus communis]PKO82253.1 MAG: hypothetical protein CVU19_02805 [Betaproteobacteria bacterium HGW-Betaproteobacteria-13]
MLEDLLMTSVVTGYADTPRRLTSGAAVAACDELRLQDALETAAVCRTTRMRAGTPERAR